MHMCSAEKVGSVERNEMAERDLSELVRTEIEKNCDDLIRGNRDASEMTL